MIFDKKIRFWHIFFMLSASVLSGCSSPASPGAMTVGVTQYTLSSASSQFQEAIQIGLITGGSETNPILKSNVSNNDFKTALSQSLSLNDFLSRGNPKYVISADLVDLDQPSIGFDVTVTAKIHYHLLDLNRQRSIFDQILETPYTANFTDHLLGVERLRLANEGAIRENIGAVLKKIAALASPSNGGNVPAVAAVAPNGSFVPARSTMPQPAAASPIFTPQSAMAPPPSQVIAANSPGTGGFSGRYVGRLDLVSGNCGSGAERVLSVDGSNAEMLIYPVNGLMLRGTVDAEGRVVLENIPGTQSMVLQGKIANGAFHGQTANNACTYEMTMRKS